MSSLILRAATRALAPLLLMLSLFLLWRGHNEPGGGFIGGLVAASAAALQGIAFGPAAARRMLWLPPVGVAATGLALAVLSILPSALAGLPPMKALWAKLDLGDGAVVPLGTPLLFDIGVFLVVVGSVVALISALEHAPE
ncbi:Na(+)/H(+) antiporter subunit B [Elioraea tepida]|uniref:Na(+)/H(+) antiporter subunit B n=1 Tax=Elioraea tepida TaxID=2843330 RepID=A0A975YIW1_9PROT|nr:MnhB domain-containing protein [Elioraea tepida]QXM23813.1 Na(+)/H(+) antiporter subunit B [Elioraea tepida]